MSQGIFGAILPMVAAVPLPAQAPTDYFFVEAAALRDSIEERSADGRFLVLVGRRASTELESELLERAEGLYPTPDLIARAASAFLSDSRNRGAWPERFEESAARSGPRWWWLTTEQAWLPYAVTSDAVAHYIAVVRRLQGAPNPMERYNPGIEHSAQVEYEASVAELAGTGHAVSMRIRWRYYCGPLCGLSFEHSRRVEFDSNGNVISVAGDGPPRYLQS